MKTTVTPEKVFLRTFWRGNRSHTQPRGTEGVRSACPSRGARFPPQAPGPTLPAASQGRPPPAAPGPQRRQDGGGRSGTAEPAAPTGPIAPRFAGGLNELPLPRAERYRPRPPTATSRDPHAAGLWRRMPAQPASPDHPRGETSRRWDRASTQSPGETGRLGPGGGGRPTHPPTGAESGQERDRSSPGKGQGRQGSPGPGGSGR